MAQAQAAQSALPFRMATRRNRQPLPDLQFTQLGQFVRQDVQQVGYLSKLYVKLFGTITTGASAAGAWSNYFPYNLLQTLAFRSNEGLEIYRTNGYSNVLIQSAKRAGYSPGQGTAATNYLTSNKGMRTAVFASPAAGASLTSSTVYPINVWYEIPVATDDRLTAGLLLLQNQSTRAQIEMQLNNLVGNGGINGICNASGALGTGATISLTARIENEFFAVPNDPGSQPDTSFVHRWIEDSFSWTASGDVTYKVPVNGIISCLIVDVENNGAAQSWFSTGADPTTPNIGNFTTMYAASMVPEVEDGTIALARMRRQYCQDMPDGCWVQDFSLGAGDPDNGWDGRDVYDTSLLTEFQIKMNLTPTPTAGKIRVIREELQRRAA